MEYKKPYLRSSEASIARGACSLGSAATEGGAVPGATTCVAGTGATDTGVDICSVGSGDTKQWSANNCLAGTAIAGGCAVGADDSSPGDGCSTGNAAT